MTTTRIRRRVVAATAVLFLAAGPAAPSTSAWVDPAEIRTTVATVTTVPEGFVGVDAGDFYSLGWDERGDLFTWGSNDRGQLGLGTTGGTHVRPTHVTALEGHAVVVAAAGVDSVIALTGDGGVWTWGNPDIARNTAAPQRNAFFDRLGDEVVGVDSCGHFYLAWTASGALYSWGRPDDRLGRPHDGDPHGDPARVTAQGLDAGTVTQAAAGRFHGDAVVDGEVVAWGQGYGGASGLTLTGIPAGASVLGTAAGTRTTLVWTDAGLLYHARESAAVAPLLEVVSDVIGGAAVSAPADGDAGFWAWTSRGVLFAWGSNRDGKLGLGLMDDSPISDPLWLWGSLPAGSIPRMIGPGANHSLHVSADGRYSAAGGNEVGQLGDGSTEGRRAFATVIPVWRWP